MVDEKPCAVCGKPTDPDEWCDVCRMPIHFGCAIHTLAFECCSEACLEKARSDAREAEMAGSIDRLEALLARERQTKS